MRAWMPRRALAVLKEEKKSGSCHFFFQLFFSLLGPSRLHVSWRGVSEQPSVCSALLPSITIITIIIIIIITR